MSHTKAFASVRVDVCIMRAQTTTNTIFLRVGTCSYVYHMPQNLVLTIGALYYLSACSGDEVQPCRFLEFQVQGLVLRKPFMPERLEMRAPGCTDRMVGLVHRLLGFEDDRTVNIVAVSATARLFVCKLLSN